MKVDLKNISNKLFEIRDKGTVFNLYYTGLDSLDEIYKAVKGYPLFIGGHVHHGKSEFALELAVSLSIHHGFKWCVYLGEAGKTEIAVIEIAQKVIGKNFFYFTESDYTYAMQFIEQYFILLEIDDLTVTGFYEEVEKTGVFDGTLFDPFNDAKNGTSQHGGRTDIWLEEDLKYIRKQSHKHNRLDIVVFHVQDIKPIKDDSGNWYSRIALPTEWAGGQVVNRRAFTQLYVYKIPKFLKDENGVEYGDNKTMIINQKAKPKGTGKVDKVVINWDWKANRYYEESSGTRKYMLDKTSKQIEPKMRKLEDIIGDDKEPF